MNLGDLGPTLAEMYQQGLTIEQAIERHGVEPLAPEPEPFEFKPFEPVEPLPDPVEEEDALPLPSVPDALALSTQPDGEEE
jgi:hypothetical protein